MKKLFFAVFLLAIVFYACKKEKSFESLKTELLTAGSWKIDKAILKSFPLSADTALSIDTLYTEACHADDRITFRSDKTQYFSSGALSCGSDDIPSGFITHWEWVQNEVYLQQLDPITRVAHNFKLNTLTKNSMVLEFNGIYRDSLNVDLTIYYSR